MLDRTATVVALVAALSSLAVLAYAVSTRTPALWLGYTVLVSVGFFLWQSRRDGDAT